jgi:hypothetical protein
MVAGRPGNEQRRRAFKRKQLKLLIDDGQRIERKLLEHRIDHNSRIKFDDRNKRSRDRRIDGFGIDGFGIDGFGIDGDTGIEYVFRNQRNREHRHFRLRLDFNSGIECVIRNEWNRDRRFGRLRIGVDLGFE